MKTIIQKKKNYIMSSNHLLQLQFLQEVTVLMQSYIYPLSYFSLQYLHVQMRLYVFQAVEFW